MFRRSTIFIFLFVTSLSLTAFSSPLRQAQQQGGSAWWIFPLIVVILLLLLAWWLSRSQSQEKAVPTSKAEPIAPAPPPSPRPPVVPASAPVPSQPARTPAAEVPPPPAPTPDDLTVVEGIGPKISSLLKAAGILTFAQLATTDVTRLKQILAEANLTALADPATWPEQAGLAAGGKWEALQQLQDQLKRGRRT